ncbi:MupA/Atu3671 family FMN-dependent luciferase-like monooxygenase [Paenibacillus pabuli]|uniref:MupA/Atu3671 family FMN-dependent luciferase-like monooxygenase n=1 Tax=Paenibacillus pabuli TaxID=1472 RepID=UPI003CEB21B1
MDDVILFWKKRNIKDQSGFPWCNVSSQPSENVFNNWDTSLPPDISSKLLEMSGASDYALYILLASGVTYLLSLYTGQNEVTLGVPAPVSLNEDKRLSPLLFLQANSENMYSYKDYLMHLKQSLNETLNHRLIPAHILYDMVNIETDQDDKAVFHTLVSLESLHTRDHIAAAIRSGMWFHFEKSDSEIILSIKYAGTYSKLKIKRIFEYLISFYRAVTSNPLLPLVELDVMSSEEKKLKSIALNATQMEVPRDSTIQEIFEEQARKAPIDIAVCYKDRTINYTELNERANQLAHYLREEYQIEANDRVAILLDRSEEILIGILGVLKSGAAYVPIDPSLPHNRIMEILKDSGSKVVISENKYLFHIGESTGILAIDAERLKLEKQPIFNPDPSSKFSDLAYIIYTSGSTGKPKGVMVEHKNVINFFSAMDKELQPEANDAMLALTTISFDISVLELLWTVTRGIQVTIHPNDDTQWNGLDNYLNLENEKSIEFSLFFFSSYDNEQTHDKYRLLLDSTKLADKNEFSAVWTPERHFHEFGGIYPNPSVISAALAMTTTNLRIRSGSVVSPLHDSIRIAEEWSVVDNLSNGRVEVSFASGWHADDFVLAPNKYQDRKNIMVQQIDEVRSLWRGSKIIRKNGLDKEVMVGTYPRPLQEELPVWVTTSGDKETFIQAGKIGANILTHLLGQDLDKLKENIRAYRKALKDNGHRPEKGKVSLMLHTYIGEDLEEVRKIVQGPFIHYLRSSVSLIRNLATELGVEPSALENEHVVEQVLEIAFEKFWNSSALLGTPETCSLMINKLASIGVDEAACLIDFGVDAQEVMNSFEHLIDLKNRFRPDGKSLKKEPDRKAITMMQCTPSHLGMLQSDDRSRSFLASLKKLIVGGEVFSEKLAKAMQKEISGSIYNMYGPTETTVWSMAHKLEESSGLIPLGRPIGNTRIYILDSQQRIVPTGAIGEIHIGGDGVSRGYWQRDDLTREKYIPDPYSDRPGDRLYRTGDLAMYREEGMIQYIGRQDFQIKVRGHRVELGEVEARLGEFPDIQEYAVVKRADHGLEDYLCAYYVSKRNVEAPELREFLSHYLPDYMLPSRYVQIHEMPLTYNGKIDRKALPDPSSIDKASIEGPEQPKGETETKIQRIWGELLRVNPENIGVNQNFFDIGGNSILHIQMNAMLEKWFPGKVTVANQFNLPNIRSLAEYIDGKDRVPISRLPLPKAYFNHAEVDYYSIKYFTYQLSGENYKSLNARVKEDGFSLYVVLLSIYLHLLSDTSGETTISIEEKRGENLYRLEVDFTELSDMIALFKRVKTSERSEREFVIQELMQESQEDSVLSVIPIFHAQSFDPPEWIYESNVISLAVVENAESLDITMEIIGGKLDESTCKALFNRYIRLILGFASGL